MSLPLEDFARQMWQEGIGEKVIKTFAAYYQLLVSGASGKITREQIKPPSAQNLISYETLGNGSAEELLSRIVVIKLNGGLGTSMGLSKAKSLLPVKGNMNFLDIIARQTLTLRALSGQALPLLFMDSYNTRDDTLHYLAKYPDLAKCEIPLDFLQNKFPRIRQADLRPFVSEDPAGKWNPPGHGDIFTALDDSGLLDKLLTMGIRYAFISNSDNLGATVDPAIAAYMEAHQVPFFMEVCVRSEVDKKGGHLSEDHTERLLLREVAQCPENETSEFQDIDRFKYFNTNNIWIDLQALKTKLDANDGIIILPLIINPKIVDGVPVYQLETAMGAAIGIFEGAKALVVPRSRFAPVKKTTDLLAIWSDAYELGDRYQVVLKRNRTEPPYISLEDSFYGKIDQMMSRFQGVPSLQNCESLTVKGDVSFGDDVICEGNVCITAQSPAHIKNRLCEGNITL
jgi:UTP--glucose-1-phosphate uridylyltransferase